MDLLFRRLSAITLVFICCLWPMIVAVSYRCFRSNQGLSSGCSIPLFKTFPFKKNFTPTYQRHDISYNCGSGLNKSRKYCYDLFLKDMRKICRKMKWYQRGTCRYFTRVYYRAVRIGGFYGYEIFSKKECKQTWVRNCFPKQQRMQICGLCSGR